MDIKQIVSEAFETAKPKPVYASSVLERNRQRSIKWVETLADIFRVKYSKEENVKVFSKCNKDYRNQFGLNELLCNISVVKINKTESPRHKELNYIEKALWLVESEMAKDTRQLVLDISKLVMGDGENKLFVGPLTSHNDEILEILKKISENCKVNVWVALVSHLEEWELDNKRKIEEIRLL